MTCHFYILPSSSMDKFNVGHSCDDLQDRIPWHLSNHRVFTSKAKDWELVYFEKYSDLKAAYARERQIKSWKSKQRKKEIIKLKNQLSSFRNTDTAGRVGGSPDTYRGQLPHQPQIPMRLFYFCGGI
ncbi:GIY-YIG nuclease family protein [Algoriphagus sp.]|uniref:GIY-YIG nuclease family protein n=1 Tax=Algoriphagus sp. TaxID=1872435 RepID=UPI00345D6BF9